MTDLKSLLRECDQIGVVGSPSTNTSIAVDVNEKAYQKALVGNFCVLEFIQDSKPTYPLGQIVSIALNNPYLERHSIRKIVSVRGEANPLTERHDVRLVDMVVGSSFSYDNGKLMPTIIGSVPPTGTNIYQIEQPVIDSLVEDFSSEISVIGRMYNTSIRLPMIFRHFGDYPGLGEAYHIGVFGKTGSGKSYLARMIMLSYAKNEDMSVILIDPQGEFSDEMRSPSGTFKVILEQLTKPYEVVDVSSIALSSIESLKRILYVSDFLEDLGVRKESNKENAADLIGNFFQFPKPTVTGIKTTIENSGDQTIISLLLKHIEDRVERIYVSKEPQKRVLNRLHENKKQLSEAWKKISNLFNRQGKICVDDILERVTKNKSFLIIDLSGSSTQDILWNDTVRSIVIKDIIRGLEEKGSELYRQKKSFNLLVATDEAHRLVPRERPENPDFLALKEVFVDCIRTTRKYGLGWMFISQSLASLDNEILRQLRLYFFGYGLSWGGERRVREEIVGRGAHIELYQSFRDPQTSAIYNIKDYPFMVYGPVSPLSSSGAPLFFSALDYEKEYRQFNGYY